MNPYLGGAKVGLIIPSVNTTTEPEFAWIAPGSISFHAARVFMDTTTPDAIRAMNTEVRHAAGLLATFSPDVVAYACTAGSFVDEALRHLGISHIGLATPYPEDVTAAERRFLVESGFDVVACDGEALGPRLTVEAG